MCADIGPNQPFPYVRGGGEFARRQKGQKVRIKKSDDGGTIRIRSGCDRTLDLARELRAWPPPAAAKATARL